MNHKWHTKHFYGAFKTFKKAGALFAIAPFGILVGMGALIDATIVMINLIFIAPDLPNIADNVRIILALAVASVISMIAQNAIVINTYRSAVNKTMPGLSALKQSFKMVAQTVAVHLSTLLIASGIVLFVSRVYQVIPQETLVIAQVLISLVVGLMLITLFTIKTLTIHNMVGAGSGLVESVRLSYNMLNGSHGIIVEHNIFLFIVNILALLVIFTVTSISMFVFSGIGLALSEFFGGSSSMFVSIAIVTIINITMIGALMLYNMSAWSELTKNLRRRALPSTIRHLAKTYLPL